MSAKDVAKFGLNVGVGLAKAAADPVGTTRQFVQAVPSMAKSIAGTATRLDDYATLIQANPGGKNDTRRLAAAAQVRGKGLEDVLNVATAAPMIAPALRLAAKSQQLAQLGVAEARIRLASRTLRERGGIPVYHVGEYYDTYTGTIYGPPVSVLSGRYKPVHLRQGDPNFHAGTIQSALQRQYSVGPWQSRTKIDRYEIINPKVVLPGFVDNASREAGRIADMLSQQRIAWNEGQWQRHTWNSRTRTYSYVPLTPAEQAAISADEARLVQYWNNKQTPQGKVLGYKNAIEQAGSTSYLIPKTQLQRHRHGGRANVVYTGTATVPESVPGQPAHIPYPWHFSTSALEKAYMAKDKVKYNLLPTPPKDVAALIGGGISRSTLAQDFASKKRARKGGKR